MEIETIARWCSFCRSDIAGGEISIPEDDIDLPVCDACMDNFEEMVAPLIKALVGNEPIQET